MGHKVEVFAEGWIRKDGSYAGRPTDVAEFPDGSLLVADDKWVLYESDAGPRRPNDLQLATSPS